MGGNSKKGPDSRSSQKGGKLERARRTAGEGTTKKRPVEGGPSGWGKKQT